MQSRKALVVTATSAFLLLIGGFFLTAKDQIYTAQGATMGTTWSVQINSADSASLQNIATELELLLHHLDREVFSTWAADSELSLLNARLPQEEIRVSPELMAVLAMAKALYSATNTTFDITVGPLVNLWGFGPGNTPLKRPEAAVIEEARHKLGVPDLLLDEVNLTIVKQKPMTLDLSAIAKGYAVDAAASLLIQKGYSEFLLEIGGEIRVQGLRPDHKPWVIAIEAPRSDMRVAYAAFANYGEAIAVAGSGDYRNVRDIEGILYSHEIDPRTGYPIRHNLAAVTVIADSAAKADAWATALMVLGGEDGKTLADSENLAAYFIMRDGTAFEHTYTAAFARFLYPRQGM